MRIARHGDQWLIARRLPYVHRAGFHRRPIGVWLSRALSLPELFMFEIGGVTFPIIWSIIGSALFVAVLSLLTQRPSRVE